MTAIQEQAGILLITEAIRAGIITPDQAGIHHIEETRERTIIPADHVQAQVTEQALVEPVRVQELAAPELPALLAAAERVLVRALAEWEPGPVRELTPVQVPELEPERAPGQAQAGVLLRLTVTLQKDPEHRTIQVHTIRIIQAVTIQVPTEALTTTQVISRADPKISPAVLQVHRWAAAKREVRL